MISTMRFGTRLDHASTTLRAAGWDSSGKAKCSADALCYPLLLHIIINRTPSITPVPASYINPRKPQPKHATARRHRFDLWLLPSSLSSLVKSVNYSSMQIQHVGNTLAILSEKFRILNPIPRFCKVQPSTQAQRQDKEPATPAHISHTLGTISYQKSQRLQPLPFPLKGRRSNLVAGIENRIFVPSRRGYMSVYGTLAL